MQKLQKYPKHSLQNFTKLFHKIVYINHWTIIRAVAQKKKHYYADVYVKVTSDASFFFMQAKKKK